MQDDHDQTMPPDEIPPFPQGSFIDAIRESSKTLTGQTKITINQDAVEKFLLSPAFRASFERLKVTHGQLLPLKYHSIAAELNVMSILTVLNIASGYRVPLHEATGRGAYDNIRILVMALHLSSTVEADCMSARGMVALDHQKVADLMGVLKHIHVEVPHKSLPGVVVGELGGPIFELVRIITKVLNETGEVLQNGGYPDLGTFVLEALKKARGDPDLVLQQMVRGIPAFRDMAIVDGQAVYIFKKALLMIHLVNLRFSSSPRDFIVPDTSQLPVFSDNVVPSILVHLGIIDLSSATLGLDKAFPDVDADALLQPVGPAETTKGVPKEGPVLTLEQSYALRAAAIHACEIVVGTARNLVIADQSSLWVNSISLPELDGWLWAGAKDRADYRRLGRFSLRNTEFF